MGEKVRVEVTFNTDKHADILEAMKKFGNQAGFLKFAAAYYVNTMTASSNAVAQSVPQSLIDQGSKTIVNKRSDVEKKRRLPPGIGNQAISIRMEDRT